VFDTDQAAWCEQRIAQSGGQILCGGQRQDHLLAPTLVERPNPHSPLVCEGLFGPALWIRPGDKEDFACLWRTNRFPLAAGVLSPSAHASEWLARLPHLARLSLNGDPSVEHVFEPWGGYAGSGNNPVSHWHEKYQRVVQVDTTACPG
jgi:acyl-CoA reductase-like NAD-dependent aldehyde dehydrogenase